MRRKVTYDRNNKSREEVLAARKRNEEIRLKRKSRLTEEQKREIIEGYNGLDTVIHFANKYGKSRQGIYKVLWKAGIDTSKQNSRRKSICENCKKEVFKVKSQLRRYYKHHFCDYRCYYQWLNRNEKENPLIMSRYGSMKARTLVRQYFCLLRKNIVHHENRNQNDNRLENLRVFRDVGDHVRYHRDYDVEPIWDGRDPYGRRKKLHDRKRKVCLKRNLE